MSEFYYCPKCNEVQEFVVVKKTVSARFLKCTKCGSETIDFGPLAL